MKVLALIYGDESRWDSAADGDREAVYAKYRAFGEAAGDKVVSGAELASTRTATTVRVRDGQTVVTARADRVGLVNPPPRWRLTRGLIDQAVTFGAAGRPSATELRSMYREGTPEARAAALLAPVPAAAAALAFSASMNGVR